MSTTEKEVEHCLNMIVKSQPVSDAKSKQISEETAKDKELQAVIEHLQNGWPRGSCAKYYHTRSELSVANGLLLRDNWIAILHSLRLEVLQKLHKGHLGIEKCKKRSRDTILAWHK